MRTSQGRSHEPYRSPASHAGNSPLAGQGGTDWRSRSFYRLRHRGSRKPMIENSKLYGTKLTVGPRLKKLLRERYGYELLWEEKYPDQENPTSDGRGEFQNTREWIETAKLEDVFDLWLRGRNLVGYSGLLLHAVTTFRKVIR